MDEISILIETTWAASTSYIPFPGGVAGRDVMPTTQYLYGADGVVEVNVRKSKSTGVQINRQAVKYNTLRLRYEATGTLVRA